MNVLSPRAARLVSALALFGLSGLSCSDDTPSYNPKPPTVSIVEPESGDTVPRYEVGDAIQLVVSVHDDQTAAEDLLVRWLLTHTDEGGAQVQVDLGETEADTAGRSVVVVENLDPSFYTLRAGVTDEDDLTTYAYADFIVEEPDQPPTASILDPVEGASYGVGEAISFLASVDDDGDLTALAISWNSDIDGQVDTTPPSADGIAAFTTSALSPGDHTVTLTVTDPGGQQGQAQVGISVVPDNEPPTTPTVLINPPGPTDADDLTCTAVGSVDPEGGTVTYEYAWFRDGTAFGYTDPVLPAALTENGQTWACQATAWDPEGLASDPAQAQVTIGNSLPSYSSVSLLPATATEASVLTCTPYGWYDADGDPEAAWVTWTVDGSPIAADTATLDGAWFDHFQDVQCTVTPFDGTDTGAPLVSNVVSISNTPPTAPSLVITPALPSPGDDLRCDVVAAAEDPDPDALSTTWEWYRDGLLQASLVTDTVPGDGTAIGQEWTCRARVGDGTAWSDPAEADTLIVPRAGDLVITEVMVNPDAVSDSDGEYVELWNAAPYAIELAGFTLSDGGAESHTLAPAAGSLLVSPGDYVVLARNAVQADNGGFIAPYQYTAFTLADAGDAVHIAYASVVVDSVVLTPGLGFAVPEGASLSLDPDARDETSNDDPASWCRATSLLAAGGDFGTAGLPNDACSCAEADGDGDGFGSADTCNPAFRDCDDTSAATAPGAEDPCDDGIDQDCSGEDLSCSCAETDLDGDGYGTAETCVTPDCDDADPAVHPSAAEVCDFLDNDCDALLDEGHDSDGDGYTTCDGDCSDGNDAAHPGAAEACNGFDDDCDGATDVEGSAGCADFFHDGDADLYGAGDGACLCAPTAYYSSAWDTDCNDGNNTIKPGAGEACDGVDQDCDGLVDDGFDGDGDGVTSCGGDCDDGNAAIKPGATEACNTKDDDCDGVVDDGFDTDADGFTSCGGDCDDTRPAVHPGVSESCDTLDNDCDGTTDEAGAAGCVSYYVDADEDLYGAGSPMCLCGADAPYVVTNDEDCDDANDAVRPGAPEACNAVDDDCDGTADEGYDDDGDEYTTCEGDCDDSDAAVRPGATESCNGYDDDCDGAADEGFDADGDGFTTCAGDCNDGAAGVKPGATETCNGMDDDCDGLTDIENSEGCVDYYHDGDGDSYGSGAGHCLCDDTPTYSSLFGTDCNDSNAGIHPGASESCDAIDQDCDGTIDEGFDVDGDGWTTCEGDCNDVAPGAYPGGSESCDGLDNDCDGSTDEQNAVGCDNFYYDLDNDGYGTSSYQCLCAANGYYRAVYGTDCNDANNAIRPGASETCDGVDQDCDGTVDDGFDTDNDGYTTCGGDCDDSRNTVNPGATESCNDRDDDCDGTTDEQNATGCSNFYKDVDNDSYGAGSPACLCEADGTYKVANASDCYDSNASAKPGQTSWFTVSRGDGSFDYNCDDSSSTRWSSTYDWTCDWDGCTLDTAGWDGSVPSCGTAGTYVDACAGALWICAVTNDYSQTQQCH